MRDLNIVLNSQSLKNRVMLKFFSCSANLKYLGHRKEKPILLKNKQRHTAAVSALPKTGNQRRCQVSIAKDAGKIN